ncbi:MAG: hypothetical protein J7M25_06160 [Deltaproteobacteria bacterium]|nr:hypothetical protein [Deltaproteobacteria bacterium]
MNHGRSTAGRRARLTNWLLATSKPWLMRSPAIVLTSVLAACWSHKPLYESTKAHPTTPASKEMHKQIRPVQIVMPLPPVTLCGVLPRPVQFALPLAPWFHGRRSTIMAKALANFQRLGGRRLLRPASHAPSAHTKPPTALPTDRRFMQAAEVLTWVLLNHARIDAPLPGDALRSGLLKVLERVALRPRSPASMTGAMAELADRMGDQVTATHLYRIYLEKTNVPARPSQKGRRSPYSWHGNRVPQKGHLTKSQRRARDIEQGRTVARLWLAQYFLAHGRTADAQALLKTTQAALSPRTTPSRTDLITKVLMAWTTLSSDRFVRALHQMWRVYRLQAKHPGLLDENDRLALLQSMVVAYSLSARADRARAFFQKTLRSADQPLLGRLLWSLLERYEQRGCFDRVIQLGDLTKLPPAKRIGINPDHILLARAEAFLNLARWPDAITSIGRLTNKSMKSAQRLIWSWAVLLHQTFVGSLALPQAKAADDLYRIYQQTSGLSQKEQDRVLKYRAALTLFRKQVRLAAASHERQPAPRPQGALPKRTVEAMLTARLLQAAHCHAVWKRSHADGPISLLVEMGIDPTGTVIRSRITEKSGPNHATRACSPEHTSLCHCIQRRILGWRFPSYRAANGSLIVRIPLHFCRTRRHDTNSDGQGNHLQTTSLRQGRIP